MPVPSLEGDSIHESSENLLRRINQFAFSLKKMDSRTQKQVLGSCFLIFEEKVPTKEKGKMVWPGMDFFI